MDNSFLQVHTEKQKFENDKQFFKDWIDFITSRYDTQTFRYDTLLGTEHTEAYGSERELERDDDLYTSYIAKIRRNNEYYSTRQDNKQFGFISTDNENRPLAIGQVWQRVPKIKQILDDFVGEMLKAMKNQDLYPKSISPAAQNEKTNKLKLTQSKIENPELFADLEELGVFISPLGGVEQEMETVDEIETYIENDYKTPTEVYADIIKGEILERNHFVDYQQKSLKNAAKHGVVTTEVVIKNGKTYWEVYEPEDVIWDNSIDNQHHDKFRYIGLIKRMTSAEIIDMYRDQLTEDEIKKIDNLSEESASVINGRSSLYFTSNNSNIPLISVIKGYWAAIKKTEEEEYLSFYTATKIAEVAYVDVKEVDNIVENFDDREFVCPPVIFWTPDMEQGEAHSFCSRMIHNQDLIDFYKNRINQLILQSNGRVIIVMGDKLQSTSLTQMTNDWKRMGATVINTESGDDYSTIDKNIAQVLDTSNTAEIANLLSLLEKEERMLEEITSANDITLGQQENYISQKTQQVSIEQAKKGVFSFYEGFLGMCERLVQLSVNIEKNLIPDNNNKYAIPLFNKFGVDFLDKIKNISLEDFRIRFKYLDPVTFEYRQYLLQYFEREASKENSTLTPEDFVTALSFKTVSQLKAYFKRVSRRMTQEKKQREEAAILAQQEAEQARGEIELGKANIEGQTQRDVATIKNEGNIEKEIVKSEVQ